MDAARQRHALELSVDEEAWRHALPDVEALCRDTVFAALRIAARDLSPVEISLVLTGDTAMARLNELHRGKPGATNVLSFPACDWQGGERPRDDTGAAGDQPFLLGDIVVAHGVAAAEAAEGGKTLADHLRHLLVHGVLHLLGHDHVDDDQAHEMETLEIHILGQIGVGNPYRDEQHFVA